MKVDSTFILKDWRIRVIIFLFFVFAIWRVLLFVLPTTSNFHNSSFLWGATYQLLALVGAILGILVAKKWGGVSSTFGKVVTFFSIGLLFQSFGQGISSYYVYKTGNVPYPALDDFGFFGSVIFYVAAVVLLSKVVGVKVFLKSNLNKIIIVAIPIIIVGISYFIFLFNYVYDWSNVAQTLLDLGYPIFEAIYVSIAISTLVVARKYLGGIMKWPIFFLLSALIMQYLSDFVFLYQSSRNLYIPEGINDCMYFIAYTLMAFALIYVGIAFNKVSVTEKQ